MQRDILKSLPSEIHCALAVSSDGGWCMVSLWSPTGSLGFGWKLVWAAKNSTEQRRKTGRRQGQSKLHLEKLLNNVLKYALTVCTELSLQNEGGKARDCEWRRGWRLIGHGVCLKTTTLIASLSTHSVKIFLHFSQMPGNRWPRFLGNCQSVLRAPYGA